MGTKYQRQINNTRKTLTKKGTLCTWYKPGAADVADTTPEFPELATAKRYDGVPLVLVPVNAMKDGTITYDPTLQAGTQNLFGYIPGDVPFKPEEGDAVVVQGSLTHVGYVNTTQPDGTPIIHEIGFK